MQFDANASTTDFLTVHVGTETILPMRRCRCTGRTQLTSSAHSRYSPNWRRVCWQTICSTAIFCWCAATHPTARLAPAQAHARHCTARHVANPRRVPTRVRCLHRGRSTHWSTTRSSNQLVKVCSNANTQPNALLMRAFFFLTRGCQRYTHRVADGREEQSGEGNSHPDANVFAPLAHLSWSMKELVNDRRRRTRRAPVEANTSAHSQYNALE